MNKRRAVDILQEAALASLVFHPKIGGIYSINKDITELNDGVYSVITLEYVYGDGLTMFDYPIYQGDVLRKFGEQCIGRISKTRLSMPEELSDELTCHIDKIAFQHYGKTLTVMMSDIVNDVLEGLEKHGFTRAGLASVSQDYRIIEVGCNFFIKFNSDYKANPIESMEEIKELTRRPGKG